MISYQRGKKSKIRTEERTEVLRLIIIISMIIIIGHRHAVLFVLGSGRLRQQLQSLPAGLAGLAAIGIAAAVGLLQLKVDDHPLVTSAAISSFDTAAFITSLLFTSLRYHVSHLGGVDDVLIELFAGT